ncbi:MAG: cell wall anchor protein [Duncaniella sp.]|nr:cell wall anchor protein [Duncaniella sp.]
MMKTKILLRIAAVMALLSMSLTSMARPDSRVTLQLDSAHLLMGKATTLHLNLTGPRDENAMLVVPQDTFNAKVEVMKLLKADTIDHGNGRWEINQDIVLQSFDSGDYRLAPVYYITGGDTISSNRLVLRVYPVAKDSLTLNDFADISDVDRKWADYLPDFIVDYWGAILIALLLIGGGIYGYILYMRRKKNPEAEEKKQPLLSPYDQAMTDLSALRARNLCERGQEKEYYSVLTDILRNYLMRRFGINAMEMTSTQILKALRDNPDTRISKKYMDQVLEIADFVKFAKVRPLPVDNVRTYDNAVSFVENTKPAPEPGPADNAETVENKN